MDGVGLVPVVMGLFGISEVLLNIEMTIKQEVFTTKVKGLLPTLEDWARSIWSILRGTVIGFFLGILPGGGAVIASFVSYAVEKRVSKHPEQFGQGAIEGVAAPESANNAAAQGAFIPLLTLGIPANVVMALLLGALVIHGVTPGPLLLSDIPNSSGVWSPACTSGMPCCWSSISPHRNVGEAAESSLPDPLSPDYPLLPDRRLHHQQQSTDLLIMLVFGGIGWFMKKLSLEAAPLILAFVLGPMLETALRQSLIKSQGNFLVFFTRPISAMFLIIAITLLVAPMLPWFRHRRPGRCPGARGFRLTPSARAEN